MNVIQQTLWRSLLAACLCVALFIMAGGASAATDYYVAPAGPGGGGTNWATAFSNAQDAATLATNAGDKIYLQCGVYSNASQLVISNAAGLTIVGGCVGNGTNDYSGTNSTLTKTGGVMRIVYGQSSTMIVANVTVSGGLFTNGANFGAGLLFTNCVATLTNCVVQDNTNNSASTSYGGGVFAAGGSLTVIGSAFYNNQLRITSERGYGGAIAAVGCPLIVRGSGSVVSNNMVLGSGITYGGAVYATNGTLTLEGATLIRNSANSMTDHADAYGGAVHHVGNGMAATFTGCWFEANAARVAAEYGPTAYGGALYLAGATGVIANCTFTNNAAGSNNTTATAQGGCVYASGLRSLQVFSSVFQGNRVTGTVSKSGGAFYVTGCSTLVVDRCAVDNGGVAVGAEHIYVSGGARAWVLNSSVRNSSSWRGLYFNASAANLEITNCLIANNGSDGLYLAAGTASVANCMVTSNGGYGINWASGVLALTNCLLAQNVNDGILVSTGAVVAANCTLADNGGWGLNLAGATGAVVNSIAWGNGSGGFASNANLGVNYSCSQTAPYGGGVSNLVGIDPQFVNAPGYYYLSVNGLTNQVTNSPCIDAGSNTPAFWGLDSGTTRTDGTNDTNAVVDLGYHYTNGLDDSHILPPAPTVCYVDAVNGTNTNDGSTWGAAWKTVTKALATVAQNATINVATGAYNAANGETFPLTVQKANVSIIASNSNPALTVVDNGGAAGANVFTASGKGSITLQGLTFRGGRFSTGANNGGGLYFQNCGVTLTNCVVRDNTNNFSSPSYGGGVYAAGGSLTMVDTAFYNNTLMCNGLRGYGGGVAAVNCPLVVRGSGSVFSNNAVSVGETYGGAVYATNGTLTLEGATLIGNLADSRAAYDYAYGGAVYHVGNGMAATFTGCWFEVNAARVAAEYGPTAYGGALYLAGATGVIANCTFTNNAAGSNNTTATAQGGCVYASGLRSLQVFSSVFQGNRVTGTVSKSGGAFYVTGCSTLVVDRCTVDSGGVAVGAEHIYVSGGARALVLNSSVRNSTAWRGLYFNASAANLEITNCLIANNGSDGLYLAAGTACVANCMVTSNSGYGINWASGVLALTNCLVAQNVNDGILAATGAVVAANCTLADNGGWGLNLAAGTGAVVNSIAWGNGSGGFSSNANLGVNYSCSQTAPYGGGESNLIGIDPQFVNAPGYYYLAVNGLTNQVTNSPCIDAGSNTPGFWGLDSGTTRTDGTNDTNAVVDLGYHYTNGLDASHILPPAPTVCYVDAVNGTNTNDGSTWGAAWKTVTKALATVAQNATIHVAVGAYNAANGETFPLTVQKANLSVIASNSNPALTVLDNGGASGANVFTASGKGSIALQGLTFRGGRFSTGANNGGGLYFQNCTVTLTNCVVRDNTNGCTTTSYGGGVYAAGGSLTMINSAFYNNQLRITGEQGYGGAIAAVNCPLLVLGSGSVFSNNTVSGAGGITYGGAVYATNGALALDGATLIANLADSQADYDNAYGGAVYHVGNGMAATFTGCWFEANAARVNYSYGPTAYGGALYLAGATGVIANCTFTNNAAGSNNMSLYAQGGCVYASGLRCLQVFSSVFQGNRVTGTTSKIGGAFYVTGCSTLVVDRCTVDCGGVAVGAEHVYIVGNIQASFANTTLRNNSGYRGVYFIGSGSSTLFMTNCLVAHNGGDGMLISSGAAAVVNCTLADNVGWGIARPTSAGLTVKNSILWGNNLGGIGHNQNLTLTYTDSQDGWAAGLGAGNFSADPLFVNPAGGDFHEHGVEGSYHNGAWDPDARNSPCLDAGDPASDWSREPKPCGNRINAGAYGNTAEATRSLPKVGTVISVR